MSCCDNHNNRKHLLDHALHLLEIATALEEKCRNNNNGDNEHQRIEAATKYYEAVYLLKQFLDGLPHTSSKSNTSIRLLLSAKASYYENRASNLLEQVLQATAAATTTSTGTAATTTGHAAGIGPSATIPRGSFVSEDDVENHEATVPFAMAVPIPSSSSSSSTATCRATWPLPPEPITATGTATNYYGGGGSAVGGKSVSMSLEDLEREANGRLARAMDMDERQRHQQQRQQEKQQQHQDAVIEEYMGAAELYLRCIKRIEEDKEKENRFVDEQRCRRQRQQQGRSAHSDLINYYKRLLKGTLDRVEDLKYPPPIRKHIIHRRWDATTMTTKRIRSTPPTSSPPPSLFRRLRQSFR